MGFMMMVVVAGKRGGMGKRQIKIKWGRYILGALRFASLRNTQDVTAYAASPVALIPRLAIGGPKRGTLSGKSQSSLSIHPHPGRLSRPQPLFFSPSDGLIPVCSILCPPFD